MKAKLQILTCSLLLIAGSVLTAKASVPYAVLSDNNTTLTFYYDGQKDSRNGMGIEPFSYTYDYEKQDVVIANSAWDAYREKITTVIFDDSFANCTSITSTAYWFYLFESLTSLVGLDHLKTINVTDMSEMFGFCSSLKNLDLSSFNTENVADMSGMFGNCSSLIRLDLSNFNTENVKHMRYVFSRCTSLTSLNLGSFNTKNVTEMAGMFYGCSHLTTIYVSDLWSTESVGPGWGGYMFTDCFELKGGNGTAYDSSKIDYSYAHIDGGENNPGYFTDVNTSGLNGVPNFSHITEDVYYSLDGRHLSTPQKGLNIMRMGNGVTKKVMAK